MKKKILTVLLPAAAMVMASCGEKPACQHVDDKEPWHYCDLCNEKISDCKDDNNDHLCDLCGSKISEHIDSDKNHKCDTCEETMGEHADKNGDGKCDYCNQPMVAPEKKVSLIFVAQMPIRTSYFEGEEFDPLGMKIGVIYNDNSSELIDEGFVFEKAPLTLNDTKVTFSYGGKTVDLQITVSSKSSDVDYVQEFNRIMNLIKTNHNYQIDIESAFGNFEDTLYANTFYNISDNAIYYKESGMYMGVVKYPGKGFMTFTSLDGNNVVPGSIFATNSAVGASKVFSLCAESLLNGSSFTQDSTNKAKFVQGDEYANNIAYNMCGYGYPVAWTSPKGDSFDIFVDPIKNELKIQYNYSVYYIDEITGDEHNEPGVAYYTIKEIGSTSNAAIDAYISNPTPELVNPTKFSSDEEDLLMSEFGMVPSFMPNATYAFGVSIGDEGMYDEHVLIDDYYSGDQRAAYGALLVANDGFVQSSTNPDNYTKVVRDEAAKTKTTYTIKFGFNAPSEEIDDYGHKYGDYYPNGYMYAKLTSKTVTDDVNSVDSFNKYVDANHLNDVVPYLPASASVSQITNFVDNSSSYPGYRFVTSTGYIKIHIADYATAKAYAESYISSLEGYGYTSIERGKNLFAGIANIRRPHEDSYISITDFEYVTAATYSGYIQLRFYLLKVDDPEPTIKYSVSASSSIVNGSISFGETTEYGAGRSVSFDIVPDAGYEFESASIVGKPEVEVSVVGNKGSFVMPAANTEVMVTFKKVTPTPEPSHLISLSGNHVTSYSFEDYEGNPITKFEPGPLDDKYFVINITLESGYQLYSMSLAGDPSCEFIPLSENEITVWPSTGGLALDEFAVSVVATPVEPVPTSTHILKKQSFTGGSFTFINPKTIMSSGAEVAEGSLVEFTATAQGGRALESIFVVDHPEIIINTYIDENGKTHCSFPMPAFDCTVSATTIELPKHSLTYEVDSTEGEFFNHDTGSFGPGTVIYFNFKEKGAHVLDHFEVVDHPEIEIKTQLDQYGKVMYYYFNMPNEDCTLKAVMDGTTPEPEQGHIVTAKAGLTNGSVSIVDGYTELSSGQTGYVLATPVEGCSVDSVYVDGHPEIEFTKVSGNKYSFTMPDYDIEVSATFAGTPVTYYNLSYATGLEHGTVSSAGKDSYKQGANAAVVVLPDEGYEVESIDVVGHEGEVKFNFAPIQLVKGEYDFLMPAYDCLITAKFRLITEKHAVTVASNIENGRVEFDGGEFAEGDKVEFKAIANKGYEIDEITAGGQQITDNGDGNYSFIMPNEAVEINATFKQTGGEVTTVSYYFQSVGTVSTYDCYINISSDGTGWYEARKVGGATYVFYFKIVSQSGSTIVIEKDPNQTSSALIGSNVNIWNSDTNYSNTLTISGDKITVKLYNKSYDSAGVSREFVKQ